LYKKEVMAKQAFNNIRLGVFVLAGMFFLILTLYMLGKNRNLFGSTFTLKAHFENVNGLRAGNNIRFAGIEAGTVKKVKILSDTLIEVTMAIDTKMNGFIPKNAEVTIGTDGLVGNKILNITPVQQRAVPVKDGDVLITKKSTGTEEMLKTLSNTNDNIAFVSEELKLTIRRFNNSKALWTLLNDSTISPNLKASVYNVRQASARANEFADQLNAMMSGIKNGEGSLGALLSDTSFVYNLNEAVYKIQQLGNNANELAAKLNEMAKGIQSDVNTGKGTANLILKDSVFAGHLNQSIENIEKATAAFNRNMEALKHNFLFRGYFRKLEKQKKKK
jgi:phospholipid/cholesterol/gamma-HCH transport system substrate-binding protein